LNLLNLDEEAYTQYLDYLRQLGILLQTFTASSVFTLDHIHRLYVHDTGSQWNIIENTLENSVLKKKDEVGRGPVHNASSYQSGRRGGKFDNREGRHVNPASVSDNSDKVCWKYNMRNGCNYSAERCYYPHVCSVDGCRGNHPAYKHTESHGHGAGSDKPKSSS
jgi:hypothetical protein